MAITLKPGQLVYLVSDILDVEGKIVHEAGYPPESLTGTLIVGHGQWIDDYKPLLYLGTQLNSVLSQWNSKVLVGETVLVVRGSHLKKIE